MPTSGETTTVFLPAARNLLSLAAKLEEERDHSLAPKQSTVEDDAEFEERVDRLEPTRAITALEAAAELRTCWPAAPRRLAHRGSARTTPTSSDCLGCSPPIRRRRGPGGGRVDCDLMGSRLRATATRPAVTSPAEDLVDPMLACRALAALVSERHRTDPASTSGCDRPALNPVCSVTGAGRDGHGLLSGAESVCGHDPQRWLGIWLASLFCA